MRIIERTGLAVIEQHLQGLGAGNHDDNMTQLRRFECYHSIELTEEEFFRLVFLQNDEVLRIAPRGDDRTLRRVAERAIRFEQPTLSPNWDLNKNLRRMREKIAKEGLLLEPLVVRESNSTEQQHGPFYLQDGSHRALAYATLILLKEVEYRDLTAFTAMSQRSYESLASNEK